MILQMCFAIIIGSSVVGMLNYSQEAPQAILAMNLSQFSVY